jgi:hypothetical protein
MIAVNSTVSALVNGETTSGIAQELLTNEDGNKSASVTIYEVARHNVNARTEKSFVTSG